MRVAHLRSCHSTEVSDRCIRLTRAGCSQHSVARRFCDRVRAPSRREHRDLIDPPYIRAISTVCEMALDQRRRKVGTSSGFIAAPR
jgi:hypothetical protein